jgi:hypothetical protein
MAIVAPARPDLAAHRQATTAVLSEIVEELARILGKKLTAYIGGVKDVRAVERWIAGAEAYNNAEGRIRLAFQMAKTISSKEDNRVVQAWFIGLNPELNDRSPIRLLREGHPETVGPKLMGAVRAFLAGG